MIYQQKPKLQEGDMRIYNLMWTPKQLGRNKLTRVNTLKLKNVVAKNPRRK